jgi:FXSXX-COOH protein
MAKDIDLGIIAKLPTLDRLSLGDVLGLRQPVLRSVLGRCKDAAARPAEQITAFNNYVTAESV